MSSNHRILYTKFSPEAIGPYRLVNNIPDSFNPFDY